jgi:MFS transporter, SP family, sugar:H+ symporter
MALKRWFPRKQSEARPSNITIQQEKSTTENTASSATPVDRSEINAPPQTVLRDAEATDDNYDRLPITRPAILLGGIASIGGFIFGYESAQISGMERLICLMSTY